MEKAKNTEITEHTPLLQLAGPMFFEMLLGILLHNVDTLMLSHYSENSVGAVGNANQIMSLLIFNVRHYCHSNVGCGGAIFRSEAI